jgi:hypothetical protein
MTSIVKDDFVISNAQNITNVFTIQFNSACKPIIESFTNIIVGGTVTSDFKTFRFRAFTVKTFEQFQKEQNLENGAKNLRIHTVAKLFMNLAIQLKFLICTHSKSFIGFHPENVFVIDDNKFIYISCEHLSNINNNLIKLTYPFTPYDFFLSPEQSKIKDLPSQVHFKTAYYSLACLIIYALFPETEFIKENKVVHENWIKALDESYIHGTTSLYGILQRCLVEEAKDRSIIFM